MDDLISRQAAIDAVNRINRTDNWKTAMIWALTSLPSAQPERKNDQPESAKEYCAECDHIEMCGWYPYEGCEFRSIPKPERKKGKWIPVDSFSAFGGDEAMWMAHGNPVAFYYCSECKEQAYAGEDGESLLTDFCPSCGADMRGESDE